MDNDKLDSLIEAIKALQDAVVQQQQTTVKDKEERKKQAQERKEQADKRKKENEEKARVDKEYQNSIQFLKKALDQANDIQVQLRRINMSVVDTMSLQLDTQTPLMGELINSLGSFTTSIATIGASIAAPVQELTETTENVNSAVNTSTQQLSQTWTLTADQMSQNTKDLNQAYDNMVDQFFGMVRSGDSTSQERAAFRATMSAVKAARDESQIRDAKAAGTYQEVMTPAAGSASPVEATQANVEALNTLTQATNNAATIQQESNKRALGVAELTTKAIDSYVPASTALNARMALVQNGLEGNSAGLGRFLARSDLLGENIQELAGGMRTLKLSLAMNDKQQAELATNIQDAAKTYQTSTGNVVAALNRFGDSLAILNRTQSGQTNDLITKMVAMTDRFAPGALQSILTPLVSQGGESLARMGVLGISGEMDKILGGEGSVDDMISVLKNLVGTRENLVGTGGQAVIGSEVFQTVTGFSLAQANQAESLIEILEEQKKNQELTARLEDALNTIKGVMESLKEPLTQAAVILAQVVEVIANVLGSALGKAIVTFVGITALVYKLLTVVKGIAIMSKISQGLAAIRTFALGAMASIFLWIALGIGALVAALVWWKSSSEETAKNTKVTADEVKKKQNQDFMNSVEEYNRRFGAALSTIARMSTRSELESQMTDVGAEVNREQTNALLERVVAELQGQSQKMTSRTSAFAGAGNSGDGSK